MTKEAKSEEEKWLSLAAALDEVLAKGEIPANLPTELTAGAMSPDLNRGLACMHLLRRVWPAGNSGTNRIRPGEPPTQEPPIPHVRKQIGRFEIVKELGRGGFGVVFLARDAELGREIALKVPRPGVLVDPHLSERFRQEARAAAVLDHPNVVPVYEAGEADGLSYIASAYCPGTNLANWLRDHSEPVPGREAAELVATLADAVQHAHERGVWHRDLKPANILLVSREAANEQSGPGVGSNTGVVQVGVVLEPQPGAPQPPSPAPTVSALTTYHPRISDFGLAKVFNVDGPEGLTRSGEMLGTPSYMAPEQAIGKSGMAGPATDVYGLGTILYELLTGRPPFQEESALDTLLQVKQAEPVPPVRLRPRLPRDLNTICLKCLEKEPGKRYASAGDLGQDLRRFLAGETIEARPATPWEKAWKWAKRQPLLALLIALLAMVTVVGFALVTWKWLDAEDARAEEQQAKLTAQNAYHLAEQRRKQVEQSLRETSISLYINRIAAAERELLGNNPGAAEQILAESPEELRHWEWHYLKQLCQGSLLTLRGHVHEAYTVAFHPRGHQLASADTEHILIWDASMGKQIRRLKGHSAPIACVAYSSDGKYLASSSWDKTVRLWDAKTGKLVRTLEGHSEGVAWVAFSPKGERLATASHDGTLRLWDLTGAKEPQIIRGHAKPVIGVAFSPDGKQIVTASLDGTARVWDAANGKSVFVFRDHPGRVVAAAFHPDGRRIASCAFVPNPAGVSSGEIKVWQARTGQVDYTLHGFKGGVFHLAFSPDGKKLAAAASGEGDHETTRNSELKTWDADTGRELLFLRGHRKRIHQVAFSADGKRLASCSRDGSVKIWDAHFGTEARMVQGHTGALLTMAFSGDGGLLATAAKDRTIKLWDMQRWNPGDLMPPVRPLPNFDGLIYSLALQGTGERLAVCYFQKKQYPGLVHVWDVASGKQTFELKGEPAFRKVVFSPDGRHLALDGPERTVSIWDLSTRKSAPALKKGRGEPLDLAYSPDGSRVASAEGEGIIKVWDCETGELVHELQGHRHGKLRVGFCPKGRYLASAGEDSHLILWDPATGKEIRKLKHDGPLHSLAISPDGLRVAVACADSSVQIWEVTTGQRTLRLRVPGRPVYEVRFSPDGHRLAALVGGDAALRIWDASPMP